MEILSQNKTAANTTAIEVKFSAEEFESAVQSVYNRRKSGINVPGFRKGKAPRKIIESHYGEGIFYDDAVNLLYNRNIGDIVEKTALKVVDVAHPEITDINKESGVILKADIISSPEVEISDYKGLELKKTVKAVTEEAVDEEINRLRRRNGREVTVEGRPVQNEDKVLLDFEGFIDGVAFDGGKGTNFPLTIGSHEFIPGFEEQIIGKNVGEDFEVNVTFPEDYQSDDFKGKASVFKCKVNEIKCLELPELNDDFVKDVDDEADTIEQLREKLKDDLSKKAEEDAANEVDNMMVDELIKRMKADVPEVMYERRIDDIVNEWSARARVSVQDYLQYTGLTREQFRANFAEAAKRQVNLRLCLEKIAELENIEASDEDVEKEYAELAEQYSMDVEKVKSAIPVKSLRSDVVIDKALDLVKNSAKIEEVTE